MENYWDGWDGPTIGGLLGAGLEWKRGDLERAEWVS